MVVDGTDYKGICFLFAKTYLDIFLQWIGVKLKRLPLQKMLKGPTDNSVSHPTLVTQSHPPNPLELAWGPRLRIYKVSKALSSRLYVAWQSWRETFLGKRGQGSPAGSEVQGPGSYPLRVAKGAELGPPGTHRDSDSCCLKICVGPLPESFPTGVCILLWSGRTQSQMTSKARTLE